MHSAFYKEKETEENTCTRARTHMHTHTNSLSQFSQMHGECENSTANADFKNMKKSWNPIEKKEHKEKKYWEGWEKKKRQILPLSLLHHQKSLQEAKWTNKILFIEKKFVLELHIPKMNPGIMPISELLGLRLSLKMNALEECYLS